MFGEEIQKEQSQETRPRVDMIPNTDAFYNSSERILYAIDYENQKIDVIASGINKIKAEGEMIYYTNENNVFRRDADGTITKLTDGNNNYKIEDINGTSLSAVPGTDIVIGDKSEKKNVENALSILSDLPSFTDFSIDKGNLYGKLDETFFFFPKDGDMKEARGVNHYKLKNIDSDSEKEVIAFCEVKDDEDKSIKTIKVFDNEEEISEISYHEDTWPSIHGKARWLLPEKLKHDAKEALKDE